MDRGIISEISEAAVRLAEYVHDNKFEGILVSGGSNQLSKSLLALAWQRRFCGEKMPQIYTFNQEANTLLYKREGHTSVLVSQISDWISANLPKLEKIKQHNLCYIDDYAVSGFKYGSLKQRFEQLEFNNLKFAFFGATPSSVLDEGVFVGTFNAKVTKELQSLSVKIQGWESLPELVDEIKITAESSRLQALNSIREIGNHIKLR